MRIIVLLAFLVQFTGSTSLFVPQHKSYSYTNPIAGWSISWPKSWSADEDVAGVSLKLDTLVVDLQTVTPWDIEEFSSFENKIDFNDSRSCLVSSEGKDNVSGQYMRDLKNDSGQRLVREDSEISWQFYSTHTGITDFFHFRECVVMFTGQAMLTIWADSLDPDFLNTDKKRLDDLLSTLTSIDGSVINPMSPYESAQINARGDYDFSPNTLSLPDQSVDTGTYTDPIWGWTMTWDPLAIRGFKLERGGFRFQSVPGSDLSLPSVQISDNHRGWNITPAGENGDCLDYVLFPIISNYVIATDADGHELAGESGSFRWSVGFNHDDAVDNHPTAYYYRACQVIAPTVADIWIYNTLSPSRFDEELAQTQKLVSTFSADPQYVTSDRLSAYAEWIPVKDAWEDLQYEVLDYMLFFCDDAVAEPDADVIAQLVASGKSLPDVFTELSFRSGTLPTEDGGRRFIFSYAYFEASYNAQVQNNLDKGLTRPPWFPERAPSLFEVAIEKLPQRCMPTATPATGG